VTVVARISMNATSASSNARVSSEDVMNSP
jgi:hypothetical protein